MRILVVEDEDSIATPLVDGLRQEGFDVERAPTAAAALAADPADVVLLDLRLPDGDGLDVCRALLVRVQLVIPGRRVQNCQHGVLDGTFE